MSTASTSGQGRKKKTPGVMDQISTFFSGGDKKKRSKGSFRGLAASPQTGSARRKPAENAVAKFFRSIVSSPLPSPKSRWRDALGLATPRAESTKSPLRHRRDQSTLSRIFNLGDTKSRPPPKRWSTIF